MIHSCSGPIPFHLQLWVDMFRFTKNGQGFVPAVWFGLNSTPGRMWGLHVMLECGAVYRNVPPHLVAFDDAPMEKLRDKPNDPCPMKTSGLSFSEALEAFKQGKTVQREQSGGWPYTITMDCKHAPSFADMIATDWRIVE